MRFIVDVKYSQSAIDAGQAPGEELTPFDQRMVRSMLESACGNALFYNAVITWSFPKEED